MIASFSRCVSHLPDLRLFRAGLTAAAAIVLLSSCGTTYTQYGDARLESTQIVGLTGTNFVLPEFSLGQRGTYEYRVEGLEARAYPYKIRIQSRDEPIDGLIHDGWSKAVLLMEILEADSGRVLAAKRFKPFPYHILGGGEYEHLFYEKGQPSIPTLSQYRVRITVERPAWRRYDKAKLLLR